MRIKAIVDTNVWISAFINKHGLPALLKEKYIKREFETIISFLLIDELSEVLVQVISVSQFLKMLNSNG